MKRGFTLIEVIITIAITGFVLAAIISLYVFYTRTYAYATADANAALGTIAIMDTVDAVTLEAVGIAPSHIFHSTTYQTGSTTVIFQLPSLSSSGDALADSYDYVGITASGTQVMELADVAPGSLRHAATHALTDVLEAFLISYDGSDYTTATGIIVSATTSAVTAAGKPVSASSEHFRLRNL